MPWHGIDADRFDLRPVVIVVWDYARTFSHVGRKIEWMLHVKRHRIEFDICVNSCIYLFFFPMSFGHFVVEKGHRFVEMLVDYWRLIRNRVKLTIHNSRIASQLNVAVDSSRFEVILQKNKHLLTRQQTTMISHFLWPMNETTRRRSHKTPNIATV